MVNKKKTISPENNKQESKVSRRGFLKKATYSAPVLMAMGQLVKPVETYALSKVAGNPYTEGETDGWNPSDS